MRETDEQLLARLAARQVPNTSLYAMGGRIPAPTRPQAQAPQRPQSKPTSSKVQLKGELGAKLSSLPSVEKQEQKDDGGGLLGTLKSIAGSGPGKAVLKGLEYMQYPGALVASTISEGVDLLNVEGKGDGSFDFGDLWQNTKDNKQFSELLVDKYWDAGPSWLKTAIGITGDIAADPLTYLSLGSTAAAGKVGRRGLARAAYEAGLSEEAIARASKGASFLTKADRAAMKEAGVGIEEAGLRFGGREGVRLPGTGAIANTIGKGTGSLRYGLTKSRPWQVIASHPEAIEEASKVLAGTSKAMTHTQAASVLAWDESFRSTWKTIAAEGEQAAKQAFKGLDEQARVAITHATESGQDTIAKAINERMLGLARQHGVDVGELDNYMTHLWSDEGHALISGDTQLGQDLTKAFKVDPTKAGGVALSRDIKGGVIKIGDKAVDLGDGTIDSINRALTKAFPEAGVTKWLEDDAGRLTAYQINSMAHNIGQVVAFKDLAKMRGGQARWLDDVSNEVLDTVENLTANKEMKKAIGDELAARGKQFGVEKAASKAQAKALRSRIGKYLQRHIDELGVVDADIAKKLQGVTDERKSLAEIRRGIGASVKQAKDQIAKEQARLEGEFFKLQEQIDAATVRASNGEATELAALEAKRAALQQQAAAGQAAEAALDELTSTSSRALHVAEQVSARADDPDFINALQNGLDENDLLDLMEKGQQASTDLAAMPQDLGAAQGAVAQQHDALAAKLAEVDSNAAAEYAKLDQAGAALDAHAAQLANEQSWPQEELKRLRALKKANKGNNVRLNQFNRVLMDFEDVVRQLPDDPELASVASLLSSYSEQVGKLTASQEGAHSAEAFLAAAKKGKLKLAFKQEAQRGWTEVAEGLLPEGQRIAVQDEVARGIQHVVQMSESGDLWKAIDKLTQFFKTYATATPGFHVRNAMTAVFMNGTEGVGLKHTLDAIKEFKAFRSNPTKYMEDIAKNDPKLYDAFKATFGSGAGGTFADADLAMSGELSSKWFDNLWTRRSRKAGEWVEGPARLALAMKTIEDGGTWRDALTKVSRIHFDYSQVSKLDRNIKRLIPFWTFMSRNLPLQLQQMVLRPAMYSAYLHAADAIGEGHEFPGMPLYLSDQNAIPLGPHGDGGQSVLAPDLPFLNMNADLQTFDPSNPLRALSNLNPVMIAPLEALGNKDYYYGGELQENPLHHVAKSIFSPIAQGERLTGQGKYDGKVMENWLRYIGVPYHTLTKEQIAREMQRRAQDG